MGTAKDYETDRIATLNSTNPTDVRVADKVAAETNNNIITKGIDISVDRQSATYQNMVSTLEAANVGKAKGAADRRIVADVFFTSGSGTPTFATADKGIFNNLWRMRNQSLGNPVDQGLPLTNGQVFDVTANGKTIKVMVIRP